MSSFVYFKFKSEKEPTRVTIDGPHTDVWNLKREIINIRRLGDGTDFDLKIYKENSNEEYTDDTEIIPKDSTVLARRLPAAVPGKGRAARYVSGKPPASAKPAIAAASFKAAAALDSALTEEEKLKAMMKITQAQWQQKQEEMSHHTRINIAGGKNFSQKAKVPDGEPPHGYVCFRCGQKGHWIQACPTNEDASYDGKPRIKKTTGIPRSMLQKVDKSDIENLDEQQRQNVMITSEGEYVLAQADKKTWQKFQDQKNATDAAKKNVQSGNKELQDLGLECPIDKRMFVDPMKTPCCGKTYCHECIENALLDNDLECPNCHTENVSLEGLEPDEETKNKMQEYSSRKDGASTATDAVDAPSPKEDKSSRRGSHDEERSPKSPSSVAGRKRTASEATESKESLSAPSAAIKRQKSSNGSEAGTPNLQDATPAASTAENSTASNTNPEFAKMMEQMSQMQNISNMNMPGAVPFNPMMMMNPMMMNMMGSMPNMNMMQGMPDFNNMNANFANSGWNNNANSQGWNNNFNQGWNSNQMGGHSGQGSWNNSRGGFRGGKKFNNYQKHNSPLPQQAPVGLENAPKGPKAMQTGSGPPAGVPTGPAAGNKFSNQQRHQGHEEDNAYMRQPVNPQRAMNRDKGRRGMRTAEYKELGS